MTLINSLQLQMAVSSDSGRGCTVKSVCSLAVGYSALGHKALWQEASKAEITGEWSKIWDPGEVASTCELGGRIRVSLWLLDHDSVRGTSIVENPRL